MSSHHYPSLCSVYRTLAVGLWVSAAILYLLGLNHGGSLALDYYAGSCLVTLLAMSFTGRVATEHVVTDAFRRQAEISRAELAAAVATALADEMVERGLVVHTGEENGLRSVTPLQ